MLRALWNFSDSPFVYVPDRPAEGASHRFKNQALDVPKGLGRFSISDIGQVNPPASYSGGSGSIFPPKGVRCLTGSIHPPCSDDIGTKFRRNGGSNPPPATAGSSNGRTPLNPHSFGSVPNHRTARKQHRKNGPSSCGPQVCISPTPRPTGSSSPTL